MKNKLSRRQQAYHKAMLALGFLPSKDTFGLIQSLFEPEPNQHEVCVAQAEMDRLDGYRPTLRKLP